MAKKSNKKTTQKVDLKKIEAALENVDTEIKIEEPKFEQPEKTETLEELAEIIEEVNNSEEKLKDAIEKNPEGSVEIIQEEITKAENIKQKIEKITKNNFTSTWNGMYID